LFIFAVGYQAGPQFFEVLRQDGLRYLTLAAIVAGSGVAIAATAARIINLEFGSVAGLLAGGLTSSPTLAAAQEGVRNGSVLLPAGVSADMAIDNIVTGYAITYIFGLAGLIIIIKLLPRILGMDLAQSAREVIADDEQATASTDHVIVFRAWRVVDPAVAAIPKEELMRRWDQFFSVRINRNGEFHLFRELDGLEQGDQVLAYGDVRFMCRLQDLGEEITGEWLEQAKTESAQIVVTSRDVAGKTLGDLKLPDRFGLYLNKLRRGRQPIPCAAETPIQRGDILDVSGHPANIDEAGDALGIVERPGFETDLLAVSIAIAAGVLVGTLSVSVFGTSIGLGSAGGLLLAGILLGFLRSAYPTFARVPEGARVFLMDFGLQIFMTGVGLRAGSTIIETAKASGPSLVLAGIAVTFIPVLIGLAFAVKVLRFNPALAFGAVTGAMTSGAALSIVCKEADSDVPALGYTGTYAFANVLLTIAGTVVLALA
jgi:putative transport protein